MGGTTTETDTGEAESEAPGKGGQREGAGRPPMGGIPEGPRQYLSVNGRVFDVTFDAHSAESSEVFTVPPAVEAAFERLMHGGMATEATVMAVLLSLVDQTQRTTTQAVASALGTLRTSGKAFGSPPHPRPWHVND